MSRCYRVELPSSGAQQVVRGHESLCQSKNRCDTVWHVNLNMLRQKHKTSLWFYTFKQFVYQDLAAFLWVKMSLLCFEPQGHMERTETKVILNYTLISQSHSHLLQLTMTSSGWILFFSMPCLGCSPLPRNNPGGSILKLPMRSLWWSRRQ